MHTRSASVIAVGALTVALMAPSMVAFAAPAAAPNPVRPGEARVLNKGINVKSFKEANYKGKFPAPEGIVLQGYYGADKFKEPTGTGAYRFRVMTDAKLPLACLDNSRIIIGSKGKNYDRGWFTGYDIAKNDLAQIIQIFNDKPRGAGAGNKFYDEGFRAGYTYSFNGSYEASARYNCRKEMQDITRVDADGWMSYDEKNAAFIAKRTPSIASVSLPVRPFGVLDDNGKGLLKIPNAWVAALSSGGKTREIETANPKAQTVNIKHIEGFESADEDDRAMTAAEFADLFYKNMKTESEGAFKKYRDRVCGVSEPTVNEATYNGQAYTFLTFYRSCTGNKGKTVEWKLLSFAFTKSPSSNNLVGFYFHTPHSIRKADKDEIDMGKFPSVPFIEQFLGKVVIK